ncbi:MAG: hypothetical protein AMXMBFR64_34580 [Myxococcales bacterium]
MTLLARSCLLSLVIAASCADDASDGADVMSAPGDVVGDVGDAQDGGTDVDPADVPFADGAAPADVPETGEVGEVDDGDASPEPDAGDTPAMDAGEPDGDAGGCVLSNGGVETCNGVDDDCDGQVDEDTCDDGDPCTFDVCIAGVGCGIDPYVVICCDTAADCYDANSCTNEDCVDGVCSYELNLPGICCFSDADCDDQNECTDDLCMGSYCQHYASKAPGCCSITADCNDGDPCTLDLCDQYHCAHANTCCTSDAECADGDDKCTIDQCLEQTCVHTPTLAQGCCIESIYVGDFEDGTTEGHAIYNSVPGTGWQVVTTGRAVSGNGALYYGNPFTWTYDTGAQSNHGSASGPVMILPAAVDVKMQFMLWMATEGTLAVDQLTVRVLLVEGGVVSKLPIVWTKAKLPQYATWVPVQIDLSAFAGQMIRVSFDFNTIDATFNSFEGIYLDDLFVVSTCKARSCAGQPDCDDGLSITEEKCAGGFCAYQLSPGYCEYDFQCNDSNDCTTDKCVANVCTYSESDGCCLTDADCDDGLACTMDTCYPSWPVNICSHLWKSGCCQNDAVGKAIGCDDLDPCTTDTCPEDGKACVHTPVPDCCVKDADCEDGDACTLDICQASSCLHVNQCCASDADCDDGDDLCTAEACVGGKCKVSLVSLPGCCTSTMLAESFDSPGGWTLSPVTPPVGGVSWNQSSLQSHSPPSSAWFGDPITGTYDAAGKTAYGVLQSGPLDVPVGAFTWVSLWFWLGNEFAFGGYPNAEWDRLRVEVQLLDAQQQLDGPPKVLWDSAWGTPTWWTEGAQGKPTGPKWTSLDQVDLTPFAGKRLALRVVFDSLDGDANGYPGAFVDDVIVTRTCGPQPK